MTRDRSKIESALLRKGFIQDDTHHHYYIYRNISGQKTAKRTRMSHGTAYKTIGDPLLGEMARQLGLVKKQFLELVDCTLDQQGYEKLVF
jgi:hypothetical protein